MILALVKTLQALLEIKAIRAHWELERDIDYYIQRLEEEISKARRAGDDARADLLRHRLLRSSGIAIPRAPDFAVERRGSAPSGNK